MSTVLGLSLDEMFSEELKKRREEAHEYLGEKMGKQKIKKDKNEEKRFPIAISNTLPLVCNLNHGGMVQIDSITIDKKNEGRFYRIMLGVEGKVLEQTIEADIITFWYKVFDINNDAIDYDYITTNASLKGEWFRIQREIFTRVDWGNQVRIMVMEIK